MVLLAGKDGENLTAPAALSCCWSTPRGSVTTARRAVMLCFSQLDAGAEDDEDVEDEEDVLCLLSVSGAAAPAPAPAPLSEEEEGGAR